MSLNAADGRIEELFAGLWYEGSGLMAAWVGPPGPARPKGPVDGARPVNELGIGGTRVDILQRSSGPSTIPISSALDWATRATPL